MAKSTIPSRRNLPSDSDSSIIDFQIANLSNEIAATATPNKPQSLLQVQNPWGGKDEEDEEEEELLVVSSGESGGEGAEDIRAPALVLSSDDDEDYKQGIEQSKIKTAATQIRIISRIANRGSWKLTELCFSVCIFCFQLFCSER